MKRALMATFAAAALSISGTVVALPASVATPASYQTYPHQLSGMVAPNATVSDGTFTSTDRDGTKIYYKKNIVPNAKGVVFLLHGLMEHSGRYDYVTYRLNLAGYNVFRLDHRGHGKSAAPYNEERKGNIDSFDMLVEDVNQLVEMGKAEFPGLPTTMFGHSMGALTTQVYLGKYPNSVDNAVTNGGGIIFNPHSSNTLEPEYRTPANLSPENLGYDKPVVGNTRLDKILGVNLSALRPEQAAQYLNSGYTPAPASQVDVPNPLASDVAADAIVRDEYTKDPLNSSTLTPATATALLYSMAKSGLTAANYTKPILIMHGGKDSIVPLFTDISWYNAVGSQDKHMIVWEHLLHETLNETVRDQVIDVVIEFLDKHAK